MNTDPTHGADIEPGAMALRGVRVLVVDDDGICREIAQGLLEAQGAQVTLAVNGAEAASICLGAGPRPDVMLIDNEMPVLTGIGATALIRRRLTDIELPIVGLSSRSAPADRAAALAAGMNDYLCKPFDIDLVLPALLRHRPAAP